MTRLRDVFDPALIRLDLKSTSRDEVIKELVSMLALDARSKARLCKMLIRGENLCSTGIGRGTALVHTRTRAVGRLCVGFGRRPEGIEFKAVDGQPVYHFFLLVAPPVDTSNEFLSVLGKLASLVKESDLPDLLATVETPEEFLQVINAKDIWQS